MKTQFLFAVVILLCLTSCKEQHNRGNSNSKPDVQETVDVDTSNIGILRLDPNSTWITIFENSESADLSQIELANIERLLLQCIHEYNAKEVSNFNRYQEDYPEAKLFVNDFTIELSEYKRQYLAVRNEKGEKEVWVNCFCSNHNPNRKNDNSLVLVLDGGKCYFNLKINLSTKVYYDLRVNGNA